MQESVTFQAFGVAEDKINGTKVQFIPAKYELPSSSKAPIHTYFDEYTEEKDGELTNALRGHPVNGRKFKMPDGYLGVVYEENKTKLSETNRTLKFQQPADPSELAKFVENQKINVAVKLKSEDDNEQVAE